MKTEFFLGANSGEGFYSLYEEYCREKGGFFYLIKGSAGGGKSGFMKKIAQRAENEGYDTELIRCSGDPDSLDGVFITQLKTGWLDATSPHIIEPSVFGANSYYVNLGSFCTRAYTADIARYTEKYKAMYSTAYSYLKAANCVNYAEIPDLIEQNAIEKARQRAKSAAQRLIGKGSGEIGSPSRRFLRCIGCHGELVLTDGINTLCKHIILLDDRLGLEQYYLRELLRYVNLDNAILCPSPLSPDRLDAVLFPENGTAFVASSLMPQESTHRHVRLDALVSASAIREHRSEIKRRERQYAELMSSAVFYLKKAKEYHDLLEQAYHPYIDFPALTEFTDSEIERIFN